jgi:regulator of extracellular matrix RemA (YlzA/DUF370 family)
MLIFPFAWSTVISDSEELIVGAVRRDEKATRCMMDILWENSCYIFDQNQSPGRPAVVYRHETEQDPPMRSVIVRQTPYFRGRVHRTARPEIPGLERVNARDRIRCALNDVTSVREAMAIIVSVSFRHPAISSLAKGENAKVKTIPERHFHRR